MNTDAKSTLATLPFFFNAQEKPWFRVESPTTNPEGIIACIDACRESIKAQQEIKPNPRWTRLEQQLTDFKLNFDSIIIEEFPEYKHLTASGSGMGKNPNQNE